jgi:ABC-2 type transport system ATP-binding protein
VRELLGRFRQDLYEIRLGGALDLGPDRVLDPSAGEWLDGLSVTAADGESRIRGPISDPARLYDVLDHLRALRLPLIALEPIEPSLEDVFVHLLEEG